MSYNAFVAYIGLCILKANKFKMREIVTVKGVCFALLQEENISRANLENIRSGLHELNDNTKLSIIPIKNDFIVNWRTFKHPNTFTYEVPTEPLRIIMNSKFSADNFRMLRQFVIIASTFKPNRYKDLSAQIGNISLKELTRIRRTSVKEIQRINQQLMKLGVLAVYDRHLMLGADEWQNDLYAYGWESDQLEEYAKRMYKDKYLPVKDSDKKKKFVQMYNAVAKGHSYDKQTMIFLYNYIKKQNEYHRQIYYAEDKYKWSVRKFHRDKIKSLAPFRRYPYIYKEGSNDRKE